MNKNESFGSANIIVTGRPGVGRSTLISSVFGQEYEKIGEKWSDSKADTPYSPVRIWEPDSFKLWDDNMDSPAEEDMITISNIMKICKGYSDKNDIAHNVHAIWYCINRGYFPSHEQGGPLPDMEFNLIKMLYLTGIPLVIIVLQSISDEKEKIEAIKAVCNKEYGINDVPVLAVCAQEQRLRARLILPSFGLNDLVDETVAVLPNCVKGSFIASQQINEELKTAWIV